MKKVFFLGFFLTYVSLYGQVNTQVWVKLKELNTYYLPTTLLKWDSLQIDSKKTALIYPINKIGAMYIRVFSKGKLIIEGKYLSSLDTLKSYVEEFDANGDSRIAVSEYFEPLKDSIWTEFDSKKKKSVKKYYQNGVEKQLPKF